MCGVAGSGRGERSGEGFEGAVRAIGSWLTRVDAGGGSLARSWRGNSTFELVALSALQGLALESVNVSPHQRL